MAIFKRKPKEDPKKIKIVDVSKKANTRPKNPSMWCAMHSCSKVACPGGMHN